MKIDNTGWKRNIISCQKTTISKILTTTKLQMFMANW